LKAKILALSLLFLIVLIACLQIPIFVNAGVLPPPPPLNSGWASKPPNINGEFFPDDEWTNPQLEIMSDIHTFVYFINDESYLYICVDAGQTTGDYTEETQDFCWFVFDVGNDNLWTEGVDTVFSITGSGHTYHFYGGPVIFSLDCEASDNKHPGFAGAIGFGSSPTTSADHRIYEIKIPLSLIGASPGATVGFSSPMGGDSLPHDYNGGASRHNVWPEGANPYDLAGWGDIVLASRRAVGGILIPVAKVEILAPWVAVALAGVALTIFATKRRR